MACRLVLAVVVLLSAVAAAPGHAEAQASEGGCTACECGVAYCEGGREYFPEVELDPLPATLASREEGLDVTWRLRLRPGNESWPPPNGTWEHGSTGVIARWSPFERDGSWYRFEPDPDATTFPAVYPGNHSLHLDLDRIGTLHLVAYGTRGGGPVGPVSTIVEVEVPGPGRTTNEHSVSETQAPMDPARGIPLIPWAAGAACLAAARAMSRRQR